MSSRERPPSGDTPLYGLDIETDTAVDGLDPAVAAVVAVAVSGGAPSDPRPLEVVLTGAEASLLRDLDDLLARLPAGILVTWNGSGFDLPFLAERGHRTGVPLALETSPDPATDGTTARVRATWHGHRHLDGYRVYRSDVGRGLGLSCGLKPLARLVGLGALEVDRDRVHDLAPAVLREYVLSDARLARALVLRRWPAAGAWVDPPAAGPDRVAVPPPPPVRGRSAVTP